MRRPALVLALAAALACSACEREARRFTSPVSNSNPLDVPRESPNQPAAPRLDGVKEAKTRHSPYDDNAYAVAQGKRLFVWFNCNGCHASGGGGIGPPLMDNEWRYGGDPASIFDSIMRGRPNGMPSFGGHIPEDQVWQLVAYVRSMPGQLRPDVAPGRSDTLFPAPPENARPSDPGRVQGAPR